jgi:hypothetical protein
VFRGLRRRGHRPFGLYDERDRIVAAVMAANTLAADKVFRSWGVSGVYIKLIEEDRGR